MLLTPTETQRQGGPTRPQAAESKSKTPSTFLPGRILLGLFLRLPYSDSDHRMCEAESTSLWYSLDHLTERGRLSGRDLARQGAAKVKPALWFEARATRKRLTSGDLAAVVNHGRGEASQTGGLASSLGYTSAAQH